MMWTLFLLLLPSLSVCAPPFSQELKNCDASGPRVSQLSLNSALSTFLCFTEEEIGAMEEVDKKRQLAQKIAPFVSYEHSYEDIVEKMIKMPSGSLVKIVNIVMNRKDVKTDLKTVEEYHFVINELMETNVDSNLDNPQLLSLVNNDMEDVGRNGRFALLGNFLQWIKLQSGEVFESLASDGQPELHKNPEVYQVQFHTDIADTPIVVEVNRTLAPIGADRFYDLVMSGFYDTGAFFRVVPGFVLQFGISGDHGQNEAWLHNAIQDDPVVGTNVAGTVSYAAPSQPNSRTTQIFINYANNSWLDAKGFAPFGRVVLGFDVAMAVHNPTPGQILGVDQQMYEEKGNDWIRVQYPGINFVQTATVRQTN